MSRYFFIVRWPDRQHGDAEGTSLESDQQALHYAKRIIGELKEAGGYDDQRLSMIVRNAMGDVVFSIPFHS